MTLWGKSSLTDSVQASHFLRAQLFENMGEPFRLPDAKPAGALLRVTYFCSLRSLKFVTLRGVEPRLQP
ncbi:MAG: hypothetical protein RIT04_308 [Candidatus Parcubacteria bacterium]